MSRFVMTAWLAATLVATGCGSSNAEGSAGVAGSWKLEAVVQGGKTTPAVGAARIEIDDAGAVTGDDGCGNELETEVDGSHIGYDGFHTLGGCIDPVANDEASEFWLVLFENPSFELTAGFLRLTASSGYGLVFAPTSGGS